SALREADPSYAKIPNQSDFIQLIGSDLNQAQKVQNEIRKQFPGWVLYGENSINNAGYNYLGKNETDKAIQVFTLYTETYPQSWNAFDSLGEAYMTKGDNDKAIATYNRSIELNPA